MEYLLVIAVGSDGGRVVMRSSDFEDLEGPARRLRRFGFRVEIQKQYVEEPDWKVFAFIGGKGASLDEVDAILAGR